MTRSRLCSHTLITSLGALAVIAGALLLGPAIKPAGASLLGYWRLDGDVADASGQNPGAAFDAEGGPPASFVPGVYDQALDLSGGKGHIDTTISLTGGPKSVVFFAKVNNYTTQQVWVVAPRADARNSIRSKAADSSASTPTPGPTRHATTTRSTRATGA